ncbi:gamma-glutamylcyclotransferase [Salinisphaera dokdonensis]|uniref:gamma-glutamylcyclotransferase n=1 Tax=Salinisphaera dokdonensis TaxID=454598 RepID=UPI003341ED2D
MNEEASGPGDLSSGITRSVLERDGIRAALQMRHPDVPLASDAQLRASIAETRALCPAQDTTGVWVFAYGSLLWNPCVAVAEARRARLYGFHRDFRLQLDYGRGSPEAPGLMLGLVPGGSCRGMALRLPDNDLDHELLMVWRREMLTGVYKPRWLSLRTADGPVTAIAFVVDPTHRCHCQLDDPEVVRLLATGHGMLGSSADYLVNTVAHLEAEGIHDSRLEALRARVTRWR